MSNESFEFAVHVRPGSHRDGLSGTHDGVLAVRVSAPPTEGRANEAVCRVLAEAFGVPRSAVAVIGGRAHKRKRVRVDGDPVALAVRLEQLRTGT